MKMEYELETEVKQLEICTRMEGVTWLATVKPNQPRSLMSQEQYNKMNLSTIKSSAVTEITDSNGCLQTVIGEAVIDARIMVYHCDEYDENDYKYEVTFLICKGLSPSITFGIDFLAKNLLGVGWTPSPSGHYLMLRTLSSKEAAERYSPLNTLL